MSRVCHRVWQRIRVFRDKSRGAGTYDDRCNGRECGFDLGDGGWCCECSVYRRGTGTDCARTRTKRHARPPRSTTTGRRTSRATTRASVGNMTALRMMVIAAATTTKRGARTGTRSCAATKASTTAGRARRGTAASLESTLSATTRRRTTTRRPMRPAAKASRTIHSQAENEAAYSACIAGGMRNCWLGLEAYDREWYWHTGEALSWTNWDGSEGTCFCGEDRAFFKTAWHGDKWHDVSGCDCEDTYPLCERSGGATTESDCAITGKSSARNAATSTTARRRRNAMGGAVVRGASAAARSDHRPLLDGSGGPSGTCLIIRRTSATCSRRPWTTTAFVPSRA